jgi:hypothetical protein
MQKPSKQSSLVQSEASMQSVWLQHSPHTPPQHAGSSPPHLGGFSQAPSSLQMSSVHARPSSHSVASVQSVVPPPAVPPIVPAVPDVPPVTEVPPVPPSPAFESSSLESPLENPEPPQATATSPDAAVTPITRSQSLCRFMN